MFVVCPWSSTRQTPLAGTYPHRTPTARPPAAKYCPECGSSRFLEVESGDGSTRQLDIPAKILRYLPFLPRLQQLYMTEETAKQMMWHKIGRRYNPDNMVHPSDGEAWTHFDGIHWEKAIEDCNVRVALAIDGHFGQPWWTFMISQRTMLRLEWIWQRCVIGQVRRCGLLLATRIGVGLRPISSWPGSIGGKYSNG